VRTDESVFWRFGGDLLSAGAAVFNLHK